MFPHIPALIGGPGDVSPRLALSSSDEETDGEAMRDTKLPDPRTIAPSSHLALRMWLVALRRARQEPNGGGDGGGEDPGQGSSQGQGRSWNWQPPGFGR